MPASSTSHRDPDRVAAALVAVLPVLNRALERRVERDLPYPRPTEGQLGLLLLVHEREGVTVREAADELLMRPNNVSALVSQLAGLGLLERRQDDADRRVAHLYPTATARERLAEVRRVRSAHVTDAVRALTDGEMDALGSALGALSSLQRHLHSPAG